MKLFVTRRLSIDPAAVAGPGIEVEVFPQDRAPSRDELRDAARRSDGLVTLLSDAIDGELLDAAPGLRVVSNHAVGLDNVDLRACAARGVMVTHTPDVLTDATADLTWALILAVARRVVESDAFLRAGQFKVWSPTMLLGKELAGCTLGIVGFGRIGQAVARRSLGFGMRVVYQSRSPAPDAIERALQARRVSLDDLFSTSDVISIHCPLNEQTRHLVNAERLQRMKRDAILVNTARGPIVDEAALAQALEQHQLGGAGLDVFEREPEVHPALPGRKDVVLLPHLGSATAATRRRMAEMAVGDAARVLRGEQPLHPAPGVSGSKKIPT
jgi:glyoxylate reductase